MTLTDPLRKLASRVFARASWLLLCLLLLQLAGEAAAASRKRRLPRFEAPAVGAPQQKLPSVCYGDSLKYGIRGDNGKSLFLWSAYTFLPNGTRVDVRLEDIVELNPNADSVRIKWRDRNDANIGGIYTIEVMERSHCGFGLPYKTDILVNTPDMVKSRAVVEYCDDQDSCLIDFSTLSAFEKYTRLYLYPSTTPLSSPTFYVHDTITRRVRYYTTDYSCAFGAVKASPLPAPKFDLGRDTVLKENEDLTIDVYNARFARYDWDTDNKSTEWWATVSPHTSAITVRGYEGDQRIRLKVTEENGCAVTDSIQIRAISETLLRIPAVFTPNGDGVNDTWVLALDPNVRFPSSVPEVLEVRIYDRTGSLVWYSNNGYEPWDGIDMYGRVLPVDSYHYEIIYIEDGTQKTARGAVTIVR